MSSLLNLYDKTHVQNFDKTEYFSAEFQPQSESGKPPEYPKERRMHIGCQVEPKFPLRITY